MDDINLNYDINRNLYNINFNKDKLSYDKIPITKSREQSILEIDDINNSSPENMGRTKKNSVKSRRFSKIYRCLWNWGLGDFKGNFRSCKWG